VASAPPSCAAAWRSSRRGYAAATLLGDPAYYGRFGFSPELAERIAAPHRVLSRGFQAVELAVGALSGGSVVSDFPAIISPDGWPLREP
jgi:predicted N-acetyltransferase YhbS